MTFSLLLPMLVLAPSAPVPPARPQRPVAVAEVAGHWTMVWGGTSYNVHFGEDGSYTCRGPGGGWFGSWRINGSQLTICERQTASPHHSLSSATSSFGYVWTANLRRSGPGMLSGSLQPGGPRTLLELTRNTNVTSSSTPSAHSAVLAGR